MNAESPLRDLSVSLALEGLKEASEAVRALETQLAEARRLRDVLTVDAIASGVKISRVSQITGLSRQYIWKLSPRRES